MDPVVLSGMIMVGLLVLFLLMGVPIGISIGLSSVVALFFWLPVGNVAHSSATRMFGGINSFPLVAIPFFILAGNIMNSGGIARRLVNCATLVTGRLPGSLAQTNIVANMLFGTVSGSGAAAAAAIGGIMGPIEEEEGYDKRYSAAVNIASAPTGMLIPPSNTLIIYAMVAGTVSVSALFMAGYIPGLLWGLGNMIVAGVMAKKLGYKSSAEKISLKKKLLILLDALPSLLMIVVVIGGILIGAFTPSEGAAIAVVYALALSAIYRTLKIKDIPKILMDSANTTCIVLFIIGISTIMSFAMAFTGIPQAASDAMLRISENPIVILLIMNVLLLFLGTFMDPTPAILIFTPIFLPIVMSFGMHPVHFGIMMTFNLCIGAITPPVGTVMFTGCRVAKLTIEDVFKRLLPFFGVTALVLMAVTYIEPLTMWLPRLLDLAR